MAKLALVFLVVCLIVGFLNIVRAIEQHHDELDHDNVQYDAVEGDEDDNERTGAKAFASISVKPRSGPGPSARSVECYACTDCPRVLANTTSKICPSSFDSTKQKACVIYAEQYRHMKRPWYVRGCVSERGSCAEIRQAHSVHTDIVKLLSCNECIGDRCNTSGASRSLSDLTMGVLALVVTPIIAKYTLS